MRERERDSKLLQRARVRQVRERAARDPAANHVVRALRLVVRRDVAGATDHGVGKVAALLDVAGHLRVAGGEPPHAALCSLERRGACRADNSLRITKSVYMYTYHYLLEVHSSAYIIIAL